MSSPHEADSFKFFIKMIHSQAANWQDLFLKEDDFIQITQTRAGLRDVNNATHPPVTGYRRRFLE